MDSPAVRPAPPTEDVVVPDGEGRASTARVSLLVLYTPRLEDCRRFYAELGLAFTAERHGRGPDHYAAVLPDGMVLELYPAGDDRLTGVLRLGLAVDASAARPPLAPGRHRLVDPDGRTVEITAVGPAECGSAQG
ncbi:glyoxalase/bleomycin resistance/dioxygenase family protein [Streptomyces sp. NBC_00347]|uniref:glyoxalase/bleomycin resistance/dioxygenase family protein n=1 Tax=Streptomyces sp. NBC_00347 TaxID=2975721 RepID=UPI002B1E1E03|nr:glyoxalase/bleomycin resistance/dioxygenase family protein [Streptomyces sp. NBC_00347]